MIPTEVLTFAASNLIGGVLTIWSKSVQHKKELLEMKLNEAGFIERTKKEAWIRGGPVTRRIIVLSVMFAVFIAPFLIKLVMPELPIYYAYTEEKGRWIFGLIGPSMEHLKYIEMKGFVILPVHTQMASAIGGYYFGVAAVK